MAPFTIIGAITERISKFMSFAVAIINYICTTGRHYASTMHFTSDDYDEFNQVHFPTFLDQSHKIRAITSTIVNSITS
jgi:hypothetical protein